MSFIKIDSSIYADRFIVNYLTNSATKSSAILLTFSGSGSCSFSDTDLVYFFYSNILLNILLKDVSYSFFFSSNYISSSSGLDKLEVFLECCCGLLLLSVFLDWDF